MSTLEQILHNKIVAILRGVPPKDVLSVANALYAGGIRVLEITLNSGDAFSQIEEIDNEMRDKMLVGAGTVLKETKSYAISKGRSLLSSAKKRSVP